jgi:phenylalanine-4-hydroxylase
MTQYVAKWPDQHGKIAWTESENQTWQQLITRQQQTIHQRACQAFIDGVEELQLPSERAPQLNDVNPALTKTGWAMQPVDGTIGVTEFFTLLSEKKFPAAFFIRTPEELDYLQQPDIFHEIFGHAPLLLNQAYADFVQWYGAYALQLNGHQKKILGRLFWYTIEFGLIQSDAGLRILGGGILSSHQETIFSLESKEPKRQPYDMQTILHTDYDYTKIQPHYFILDDIKQLYAIQQDPKLKHYLDQHQNGKDPTMFINC